MQYNVLALGECFQLLIQAAAVLLAFRAGISPAFFKHVDHPLHWLDRWRWVVSCICLALLVLSLRQLPGDLSL